MNLGTSSALYVPCHTRARKTCHHMSLLQGKLALSRVPPDQSPATSTTTTSIQFKNCRLGICRSTSGLDPSPPPDKEEDLVYKGIIFDMDGTLSVSCIDYQLMRNSLDIPEGDLFTVMETWDDGDRISSSMDTILEIEDVAAAQSQGMPGLEELLLFLKEKNCKVGLVTRNTEYSVNAFFKAVGEEYRDVFDIVMTREFPFVKPDTRCLTHFSTVWGISPSHLLMVGDSTEDVECGNAAGTASCLISGGGNEIAGGEKTRPPVGTVPTFSVDSLYELQERLERRDTPLGWGNVSDEERFAYAKSLSDDSSEEDEDFQVALDAGAPFAGLGFFNYLFESGAIEPPSCSFPRLRSTILQRDVEHVHPGDRVLHLGCGDGGLTKMLFSAGLNVCGADVDPEKAQKRGLATITVTDYASLSEAVRDQCDPSVFPAKNGFDSVVYLQDENNRDAAQAIVSNPDVIPSIRKLLKPGGRCILEIQDGLSKDDMIQLFNKNGTSWRLQDYSLLEDGTSLRCIMSLDTTILD
jgi:HAD superfamily hydrolase (TIGR01549 family)